VATLCRRAGYGHVCTSMRLRSAMKLSLRTAQHVQFVPRVGGCRPEGRRRNRYTVTMLIKADLRPAQDTWNAAYSAGVSLADAYSATLWAAMSGKDWASSWHSAQIIPGPQRRAPDWYEPSDILIGHPQTLIHNAYVGAASGGCFPCVSAPCVSPSLRTGP
jgi:hypothetical protein